MKSKGHVAILLQFYSVFDKFSEHYVLPCLEKTSTVHTHTKNPKNAIWCQMSLTVNFYGECFFRTLRFLCALMKAYPFHIRICIIIHFNCLFSSLCSSLDCKLHEGKNVYCCIPRALTEELAQGNT